MGLKREPFATKIVAEDHAGQIIIHIELQDVDPLGEILKARVNIMGVGPLPYRSPLQGGFGAVAVLILVAEHDAGPLWQREPKIGPGTADVQVQVTIQIKRGGVK